ncbi:uncharacterized protein LOC9633806 [Selaginella moellendorffii]|nr:uncharacterized protein LOC9633806 [Selaginella moellendorffii]|eukprot:XP_024540131.1 uncharacterized protein LOC9633806 [Selaginella moellendorffii]
MEPASEKMEGGTAADPIPPVSSKKTPLGTGPWYRYRHVVYTLLALNAAMVSYAVFNQDKFFAKKEKPPEGEGQASAKDEASSGEKEKKDPVFVPATQSKIDQPKVVPAPEAKVEEKKMEAPVKKPEAPHVSHDEQIELYKWMLEEKRKIKPSSSAEKARIDLEKGLLKDYIRGKVPSL